MAAYSIVSETAIHRGYGNQQDTIIYYIFLKKFLRGRSGVEVGYSNDESGDFLRP